jgi:hypothetical protein
MKKLSGITVLVSTIVLTGLCGCSSSSSDSQTSAQPAQTEKPKKPKDKRPIEDRLTVGMTMDEVKTACGNPKNETTSSDGTSIWIYNNGENAFIPFYSETGHKIHHVSVFFDNAGKVKSWSTTDTGMY